MFPKEEKPPEEDAYHFEIELLPRQRLVLLDVIRKHIAAASTAAGRAFWRNLETEIVCARRAEGPIVRARLDWTLARKRGSSEVELFEDLSHANDPTLR